MSFPACEIQRPMCGCCDAEWQYIVPICPAESAITALLFEMGCDEPHKPVPVDIILLWIIPLEYTFKVMFERRGGYMHS